MLCTVGRFRRLFVDTTRVTQITPSDLLICLRPGGLRGRSKREDIKERRRGGGGSNSDTKGVAVIEIYMKNSSVLQMMYCILFNNRRT